MKVTLERKSNEYRFTIKMEGDDRALGVGQDGKPSSLMGDNFRFQLPLEISEPHPDLLAALER